MKFEKGPGRLLRPVPNLLTTKDIDPTRYFRSD